MQSTRASYRIVNTLERILIVDDDPMVRAVVGSCLVRQGYRVLEAADGEQAMERIVREKPALVVLDIEMPRVGGLAVLSRLRESGNLTPVLIVSSRSHVDDRVNGLSLGADDYLTKPFNQEELLARIRALLRRQAATETPIQRLQFGDVEVALDKRTAVCKGRTTRLSRTECAILDLLARYAGTPVSRERLFDLVWGYTYLPETRTLDTHVWRLRKKIGDTGEEPRWIKNVPGVGYQLDCSEPAAPSSV
ncbi:two component transcriptional regulator, winged helix family [Opitutus terrae PB90-1]|uniref:Two component transcriptional regulator, winged helix family n=1 Tax=Opitutus terrae (strain DSM 11246 / JCM 15787 / PB90-1) TaxID=452637 RepID=B1ZTF2_OPITP|nr:two component transcriptional regulator, winged helix family [Opitutus terrae PB90-1]